MRILMKIKVVGLTAPTALSVLIEGDQGRARHSQTFSIQGWIFRFYFPDFFKSHSDSYKTVYTLL